MRQEVGMVSAFTGRYPSARALEAFLRQSGYRVVKTPRTTPAILEAGTTLASADYCLPLRAYVGHVHHLLSGDRAPRVLVAPNVCAEYEGSVTCSKYRDPGGVALRSLVGAVPYWVSRASPAARTRLASVLGWEEVERLTAAGARWPDLLQPSIWSLDPSRMAATGYRLLCELEGVSRWRRAIAPFLPRFLGDRLAPWGRARQVMENILSSRREGKALKEAFSWPERPRLALVGRVYLVEDPLLTADAKTFFTRAGCVVLTPDDAPLEELLPRFHQVLGYYDTHKLFTAFIDWASELPVDGFLLVSSFGCHPDAFESEWLADYARSKGFPAWFFRFDEQSGRAGFKTRFETILAFLEERRDRRLGRGRSRLPLPLLPGAPGRNPDSPPDPHEPDSPSPEGNNGERKTSPRGVELASEAPRDGSRVKIRGDPPEPLVTWPSFNPVVDLVLEEIFHQAGLARYVLPPQEPTLETIALGEGKFSESCCPYGITTGSFVQTLRDLFRRLEEEAKARGEPVRPRRIFLLQGRGEGPCTFGWYALAQAKVIPSLLKPELERAGHVLEVATLGLKDARRVLGELARLGDAGKLRPLLELADAGELDEVRSHRDGLGLKVLRGLRKLLEPAVAKLEAAETVRARALVVRAHELERGATSRAEKEAYALLRQAHSRDEVRQALHQALSLFDRVPQDPSPRPRVVSVGEIYVALSPFASRGAVDYLLGAEGIEVVEGISISDFIRSSTREMKRRALLRNRLIGRVLRWLWGRGVGILEEPLERGAGARPFLWRDVGGEGVKSVAAARKGVEEGADGVVHLYPFKCMPEGIAKDALAELCRTYGVRYLAMSFGKETDIERMRTEISTFAEILRVEMRARWHGDDPKAYRILKQKEIARRKKLGRALDYCVKTARRRALSLAGT